MRSAWGFSTPSDMPWQTRAACGPDTAELFHQASQEQERHEYSKDRAVNIALSICSRCGVRDECERYMLAQPPAARANTVAAGLVWDNRGRPKQPKSLPLRFCRYCGGAFQPNHPLNRYCSQLCQGRARRAA